MKKFFENYGKFIVTAIVMIILLSLINPLGATIKNYVLNTPVPEPEFTLTQNSAMLSNEENYVGYYADVDNDGKIDGVICFDYGYYPGYSLTVNSDKITVEPKMTTNLASYKLKTVEGQDNVVVRKESGEDRFYVMALADVPGKWYWYKKGRATAGLRKNFGMGETNTQAMKEIWDNEEWGVQYEKDIWSNTFDNWFVPSTDELKVSFYLLQTVAPAIFTSIVYWDQNTLYWTSSLPQMAYASAVCGFVFYSKTIHMNTETALLRLFTTY